MKRASLARGAALVTRTQLRRTKGMPRERRVAASAGPKAADRSTDIPQESRDTVTARSQGVCELQVPGPCTRQATDMHHRQRRREHRDHRPVNLAHACRRCHRVTHDRPELARAFGWIVSAFAVPDEAPMMLRGDRWVLLGDGYTDTEPPT